MPERATASSRSEKSAEVEVVGGVGLKTADEGPSERECSKPCRCSRHRVRSPRERGERRKRTVKPAGNSLATKPAACDANQRAQGRRRLQRR